MKKRNPFQFKNFIIHQENVALPVTTDACIFASYISQKIQDYPQNQTILDLGMGTGVLMFFLNQVLPNSMILGIEKDAYSFETAKRNLSENHSQNLSILNQDFFDWGKSNEQKFDIIISNPPFFEHQLESENPHKRQARHFSQNGFSDFFELLNSKLTDQGNTWLMLPFIPNTMVNIHEELNENKQHWSKFAEKNHLFIHSFITLQSTELKKPHVVFLHLKKSELKNSNFSKELNNYNVASDINNSIDTPTVKDYLPNIQFDQLIIYQKNRQYTKECFDLLNPFYNFDIFGS